MALTAPGWVTVVGYSLASMTSEVLSNLSDSVIFKQLNCITKERCSSLGSSTKIPQGMEGKGKSRLRKDLRATRLDCWNFDVHDQV